MLGLRATEVGGVVAGIHGPLPVHVEPGYDEALPGYVWRVASALNVTPSYLSRLVGLNRGAQTAPENFTFVKPGVNGYVAMRFGIEARQLHGMTFAPLLGHWQKASERSAMENKFGLLRRFSRLCPECIVQYGVWRKVWRHAAVVACQEHELVLIGTCHACEHLWFSNSSKELTLNRPVTSPFRMTEQVGPGGARPCHTWLEGRWCSADLGESPRIPASAPVLGAMERLLAGYNDRLWWRDDAVSTWEALKATWRKALPRDTHARDLRVPPTPTSEWLDATVNAVAAS